MLNFQALEQDYNFTTTLKDSSYDSANQIYLTNLSTKVYDFDKIKDEYVIVLDQMMLFIGKKTD